MIKNKSRPFVLLGATLLIGGVGQAQESINTSGGVAAGSGGVIAYSIGQVVYQTNSGTTGIVAEGVQHPYEISTLNTSEIAVDISLSAFPNPTVENLTLQVSDYRNEKLSYQLYDLLGNLLNQGYITGQETQINTAILSSATYFVHVVNQQNQKVKTFKIIKK